MNFTAIVSGIFAVAKAIPQVMEIIEKVYDLIIDHKYKKIRETYNLQSNKLIVLKKLLKEANTDEDRIALSIVINDLNKLQK